MNKDVRRKLKRELDNLGRVNHRNIEGAFIKAEADAERGIAYVVKDHYVGDVEIKQSANAWWMDQHKLEIVIAGLKEGQPITTICQYAGISRAQWEYFNEIHPEFAGIAEVCRTHMRSRAMETIYSDLDNPKTAWKYLEKVDPRFKTKLTLADILGPELPGMSSNLGIYETGDPEQVAAKLMQVAKTILIEHRAVKEGHAGETTSELSHSQPERPQGQPEEC